MPLITHDPIDAFATFVSSFHDTPKSFLFNPLAWPMLSTHARDADPAELRDICEYIGRRTPEESLWPQERSLIDVDGDRVRAGKLLLEGILQRENRNEIRGCLDTVLDQKWLSQPERDKLCSFLLMKASGESALSSARPSEEAVQCLLNRHLGSLEASRVETAREVAKARYDTRVTKSQRGGRPYLKDEFDRIAHLLDKALPLCKGYKAG